MSNCLISFPANAELDTECPRCGGEAGDHPAPISLMRDSEHPIHGRPSLREALNAAAIAPVLAGLALVWDCPNTEDCSRTDIPETEAECPTCGHANPSVVWIDTATGRALRPLAKNAGTTTLARVTDSVPTAYQSERTRPMTADCEFDPPCRNPVVDVVVSLNPNIPNRRACAEHAREVTEPNYDHEARCVECRDGLARSLWMNANGDVPGSSGFWAGLPWEERRHWIAEADRIIARGV